MNKTLTVFFGLLLLTNNTFADTLPMAANPDGIAVLDFKAEFDSGMQEQLTYYKEKCGYELQTDFNMANLSQGTSDEDRRSISSYCAIPITQLVMVCEKGESYKSIVAKKIKKLTCKYLGKTAKRSLTLDNGNLTWSFEYDSETTEGHATFIDKILLNIL